MIHVKNIDDGLQFLFCLSFLFTSLFHFLFLELGLGFSDKDHAVTWRGHKSHDA